MSLGPPVGHLYKSSQRRRREATSLSHYKLKGLGEDGQSMRSSNAASVQGHRCAFDGAGAFLYTPPSCEAVKPVEAPPLVWVKAFIDMIEGRGRGKSAGFCLPIDFGL